MGEWIFSGPATHHGAAYIKPSRKLSPVGCRVEKWTLLVINQVT